MKTNVILKDNIRLLIMMSIVIGAIGLMTGCKGETSYNPNIDPDNFVDVIDNKYMPLEIGTAYIYEGTTEDGFEHIEVVVTPDKKDIMGVTCTVVSDQVKIDGVLEEATYDWYAQDKDGNVWYFGEDSKTYENGKVKSTEGSWEAGIDGALPGIVMKSNIKKDDTYRQEYYYKHAEDMAQIIGFEESVKIGANSYTNVLKTKEWTPLESGFTEEKYYAAGVGMIAEEIILGGQGRIELIDVIKK